MVNLELHDKCKTLVKDFLGSISQKQADLEKEYRQDQYWRIPYNYNLDDLNIFTSVCKIIAKIDTINNIYKKEIYKSDKNMEDNAKFTLIAFLSKYISTKGNFVYSDELFEEAYNDLENYLYATSLRYRALIPLNNFECDEDIRTSDGIVIRKCTDDEYQKLYNELRIEEYYLTKYILEFNYSEKKEKTILSPDYIPEKQLNKFVSALRLYKRGDLMAAMLITEPLTWNPRGFRLPRRIYYKNTSGQNNKYKITKDEIPELIEFWDFYNKNIEKKEYNRLNTAIRRFNMLYQREDIFDKIIDIMIAFESLFLGDNKGELEFRLSTYVPTFLGGDRKQKKQHCDIIKEAYDLRSDIVHGRLVLYEREVIRNNMYNLNFDSDKSDMINEYKRITENAEDLLQKSIMKFIQEIKGGKDYKTIIKEIKDNIF